MRLRVPPDARLELSPGAWPPPAALPLWARMRAMISSEEFLQFCDKALDAYAGILRDLGDDLVCVRPDLPGANTAFGLTAHVVGVMGF